MSIIYKETYPHTVGVHAQKSFMVGAHSQKSTESTA